jgi:hypothetical protein
MIQERKRAKELNLPSPIWPTIENTHANYDECVELVCTSHLSFSSSIFSL